MRKLVYGGPAVRVALVALLFAAAAVAAPARLSEARRLQQWGRRWGDTPAADCSTLRNCRRCKRSTGCTSCTTGYRLAVDGSTGLGSCVKKGGSSEPPTTVTTPTLIPSPSPSPSQPPATVPSPPPAAQQPPSGATCGVILNNADLFGADLADGTVEGATGFNSCCIACLARPDCGSFTYVPSRSRCYLKAASGWTLSQQTASQSSIMEGRSSGGGGGSGSSGGSSGGGGTGTPTPSPPATPVPSPSPSPPPPSPSPSPSPSPGTTKPPAPATPGVPRINYGLMADGSQPKVLQVLGPSRTTYHYYHPEYRVSTLYCADAFANKPDDWLYAYPWVAYCAPYLGGMSQANCGKCLRMTNTRTKAQVIVRIVDMCGHGAVDSDQQTAFIPLDVDNQGYLDGSMPINLELVAC